jgi:hypothetical protein
MIEATDLETTAQDAGGGPVTRTRQGTDKRGNVHEIEVPVYGWKPMVLSDAATKMPLAVKVVPIHAHEGLSRRALVTQARTNLAGDARRHQVVFDQGLLEGVDRWGLDPQAMTCVVPAKDHRAVTAAARAPAAAGEGITVGRRVHTIRHGQGRAAWTARLETEVVGITGLTTDDQDGTPEHGRQHHRRDFAVNPIQAVVVRQWHGKDDGPGGNTVFLTHASVQPPLHPCDDDEDRRLIENGGRKEAKPPWDLGHPPQHTGRAVRVHVMFTCLLVALATAYRRRCEQAAVAAPASRADPRQDHRVCPALVRHLASRGIRPAGRGQAERCPARHRDTPSRAGQVRAHR